MKNVSLFGKQLFAGCKDFFSQHKSEAPCLGFDPASFKLMEILRTGAALILLHSNILIRALLLLELCLIAVIVHGDVFMLHVCH